VFVRVRWRIDLGVKPNLVRRVSRVVVLMEVCGAAMSMRVGMARKDVDIFAYGGVEGVARRFVVMMMVHRPVFVHGSSVCW
jgi:hypothetical protein